jgi:hypothetical protein
MEKIMISMVTIVIVVIFFWLLASIRAHLVMILEEFRNANNSIVQAHGTFPHGKITGETPITQDMVNKLKS